MQTKVFLIGLMVIGLAAGTWVIVRAQRQPTKQPVANDASGLYYKDSRGVYIFKPRDCGFLGCIGPDIRLEVQKYQRIPNADPATFELVLSAGNTGAILARDHRHVFYGGQLIANADAASLTVIGSYAKDKNNLYFGGMVISAVDLNTVKVLGMDFLSDRNGLYVASANPPRRADLVDPPSFKLFRPWRRANGRDYFGEDKNFSYYSNGGTYLVDNKPDTADFRKLRCGYFYFQGSVFYSIYKIAGADVANFRVLTPSVSLGPDPDSCTETYATDGRHRYLFENEVRPNDTYSNRQIDVLLLEPNDRKSISKRALLSCVRHDMPGVNFGYSQAREELPAAGMVRVNQYPEAGLIEPEIMNSQKQWQKLPAMNDAPMDGCGSVMVEQFYSAEKTKWLPRRDPSSISVRLRATGPDVLFVVCDAGYSVRLAFTNTTLIRELSKPLQQSQVEAYPLFQPGWDTGWILENKYFLGKDNAPEVWVPLRIKNVPESFQEGRGFVTVGFKYTEGQFECIDETQCSTLRIPLKFSVDFK